jgi:hypothetical protein
MGALQAGAEWKTAKGRADSSPGDGVESAEENEVGFGDTEGRLADAWSHQRTAKTAPVGQPVRQRQHQPCHR